MFNGSTTTTSCARVSRPLMKSSRVCQSRRPFTPAIVLFKHFILPYRHAYARQFSSTAVASFASPALQHDTAPSTTRVRRMRSSSPNDPITIGTEVLKTSNNYKGRYIPAARDPKAGKRKSPWLVDPERGLEGHQRLSFEILQFYEYAKPDKREAIARRKLIEQVRTHTQDVLPNHILQVFGSERTGLALPLSDIDLRLVPRKHLETSGPVLPLKRRERLRLGHALHNLGRSLHKQKDYLNVDTRYARYPLLQLCDKQTGLDVQIVGADDTSKARGIVQGYTAEFPNLRLVYFLVKTMLEARGLTQVYWGGLGSYSIFMMIVAALKHTKPRTEVPNDAANMLLRFLNFWSTVNLDQGISIEPPERFNKEETPVMTHATKTKIESGARKQLPPWMMCLRDPADATNDLGRKAYCIKHVIATIRGLKTNLLRQLQHRDQNVSFLDTIVGDVDSLQLDRRRKLRDRGLAILNDVEGDFADTADAVRGEVAPVDTSTPGIVNVVQ